MKQIPRGLHRVGKYRGRYRLMYLTLGGQKACIATLMVDPQSGDNLSRNPMSVTTESLTVVGIKGIEFRSVVINGDGTLQAKDGGKIQVINNGVSLSRDPKKLHDLLNGLLLSGSLRSTPVAASGGGAAHIRIVLLNS